MGAFSTRRANLAHCINHSQEHLYFLGQGFEPEDGLAAKLRGRIGKDSIEIMPGYGYK
jgi:hypothetical protein